MNIQKKKKKSISNEVIVSLNVFGMLMVDIIMGNPDSIVIIIIKSSVAIMLIP